MMNVEAAVARALRDATGIAAYLDVPADRPDEFLTVEQTGSSEGYAISRISLAVQAWAKSRYRARELAYRLKAAVYGLDSEANIFNPQVEGVYNDPDPDSGAPRYQLGVVVYVCE